MARNAQKDMEFRLERRKQILEAALKLFVNKGLAFTKISDIAKAAGLSHGLVYNYFESKEEIYCILAEKSLSCLTEEGNALLASSEGTALDKLYLLARNALYSSDGSEEAALYLALEQQIQISEELPSVLKDSVNPIFNEKKKPVVEIIKSGQASNEIVEGDPDQYAVMFFSMIQGMIRANAKGVIKIDDAAVSQMINLFSRRAN